MSSRADCFGCFGNKVIHTPNIDALARRGVRFENAYVNHPVCSPSRDLERRVADWLLETSDVIPWDPDPRFPKLTRPQEP